VPPTTAGITLDDLIRIAVSRRAIEERCTLT
jgi:hypothetical protein